MGLETVKEEIVRNAKEQETTLIAEARKEASRIMKEAENKKLHGWIYTQRSQYKYNKLPENRTQKLKSAGFPLFRKPHANNYDAELQAIWDDMFSQLVAYEKENGHFKVKESENKKLFLFNRTIR